MDIDAEHPHVHHHRSGHRLVDLAIPIAALFVSFISIGIAWHHGKVMQELVHQNERLVAANSLPFLQIYSSSGPEFINLQVSNAGIGPAHVRAASILVDGKPVRNINELLRACCGLKERGNISKSTLRGIMIRPGQTLDYVGVQSDTPVAARLLREAFSNRRLETRLCYCSVFDDCWVSSSADARRGLGPRPVKSCPAGEFQYRD